MLVSATYLTVAYLRFGGLAFGRTLVFIIFPLVIIWFGDAIAGAFMGQTKDKGSLGVFVSILGWLLLTVYGVVGVVMMLG